MLANSIVNVEAIGSSLGNILMSVDDDGGIGILFPVAMNRGLLLPLFRRMVGNNKWHRNQRLAELQWMAILVLAKANRGKADKKS